MANSDDLTIKKFLDTQKYLEKYLNEIHETLYKQLLYSPGPTIIIPKPDETFKIDIKQPEYEKRRDQAQQDHRDMVDAFKYAMNMKYLPLQDSKLYHCEETDGEGTRSGRNPEGGYGTEQRPYTDSNKMEDILRKKIEEDKKKAQEANIEKEKKVTKRKIML